MPRHKLLQQLIQTACRSANWGNVGLSPEERLAAALMSHAFRLQLPGLVLEAWMTSELQLALRIQEVSDWDAELERMLRRTLEQSSSLVAGLLLEEWPMVCAACAARGRQSAERPDLHATLPR